LADIAVVIVTYKTPQLVCELLQSIDDEARQYNLYIRTVVVDNASGDDTVPRIESDFPRVEVIANTVNAGPAVGFNLGLKRVMASAPYILVANSDTRVVPGSLYRLYDFLQNNPGYMGATGRLLNTDGTPQWQRTQIIRILPDRDKSENPISSALLSP